MSLHDELFDREKFLPDMKLHKIEVCSDASAGHLVSIEFTLRTLASEVVNFYPLTSIGELKNSNCKPFVIPDGC